MDQTSKLHGAIVNLAKLDGLCISHLIGNGVAMESRSSLATIQKSVKKNSSFEGVMLNLDVRINHETSFTMLPWFLVPNFVEELVAMGNAAEEQVCRSRLNYANQYLSQQANTMNLHSRVERCTECVQRAGS